MPDPTSPDPTTDPQLDSGVDSRSESNADSQPDPGVTFAHVWVSADGTTQSALAGMVADKPELRETQQTREEWDRALTEYLESPRP